jgi:putative DNA primase/helicase
MYGSDSARSKQASAPELEPIPHVDAEHWHRRCAELASWVINHLLVRRDCSGYYYLQDGKVELATAKKPLSDERIHLHFRARQTRDILGLHTTRRDPDGVCRSLWLCIDVDHHGDGEPPEANWRAALAWYGVLVTRGFRPLLIDSNGRGGFRIYLVFDQPAVTFHVRQLGRWLVRDWQELGLSECPEVFPKQDEVSPPGSEKGSYGNWVRIPGRHHKREHWSRIWDGQGWVEGDRAIDILINTKGDSPRLIPEEALRYEADRKHKPAARARRPRALGEGTQASPATGTDVERAREAIGYLGPGAKDDNGREFISDYDAWLLIGMALHELGEPGLVLWDTWSRQCGEKYDPGACAAKWATFRTAGESGVTLGTLFYYAGRNGWPGSSKPPSAMQGATPSANGPAESAGDGDQAVNEATDDPHRLARIYRALHCQHPDGLTLRLYRDEWLRWKASAYRPASVKEVNAHLNNICKSEFNRVNRIEIELWEKRGRTDDKGRPCPPPQARKVSTRLIGDVSQALASIVLLPSQTEPPSWLIHKPPFDALNTIPCRNALVHLPSFVRGEDAILTPTPQFFTTYALDYDFDPDAPEPKEWFRFLGSIWDDDQESIDTLQEWFGLCLVPDTRHQKILALIGPKRAGKDTIARILRALIAPENVAGPTLSSLATNFGLWPLIGKPLAIISDARLGGRSDIAVIVERLLTISGEGTLTIDRKNLPPWTGKLPTRFVLISNELPRLADSSGALASRLILLRLTRTFLGKEDKTLFDRLLLELPSILLWAIEGWRRLGERGHFLQPASATELLERMEDLSSPVGAFIREKCEVKGGLEIETRDLYAAWKDWCESVGRKEPGDEQTFGRNLHAALPQLSTRHTRLGAGGNQRQVRIYVGIALKNA